MSIVTLAQWGARIGRLPSRKMILPATQLILHHTVTTTTASPSVDMKVIERIGLDRFGQISYSYCVHQDGTILEGCGTRVGAHTAGQNGYTFGVAWIGNYDNLTPTAEQIRSTRWLAWWLQGQGHLKVGTYPTGGHRDVQGASTACPGIKAYRALDQLRVPWVEPQPVPPIKMEVPARMTVPINGTVVDVLKAPGGGVWMLLENGAIYAWECPDLDAPNRHPEYWQPDQKAARLEALGAGFRVIDSRGQFYEYPAP